MKRITKKKNLKLLDISAETEKIKKILSISNNEFKIKNLAMAIKAAKLCNLNENLMYRSIKKLKDVNGRLELIRSFPNNIRVFVDYAHTPDALSKTLESLKNDYGNNISLVFGWGGEIIKKDPYGEIANDNCNKIYVTDDNQEMKT